MISEFVEVILKIYEELGKDSNPKRVVETINRETNYNKKVLAAAYSWIYDKILKDLMSRKSEVPDKSGFRIASDDELQIIGLDNFNYLLHFYNVGIVNYEDMESVLHQLVLFPDSSINKEKIDALILSLFLSLDNLVLPGSRLILISSDKIN